MVYLNGMRNKLLILLLTVFGSITPVSLLAAGNFQVAAWIPYWKKDTGVAEVLQHIKTFDAISPFSYEVKPDGSLKDTLKISQDPWPAVFGSAAGNSVKIIPSISWVDANATFVVLSSSTARAAHIQNILETVRKNQFAGIDIDYENKSADTREYFSRFIKDLAVGLHKGKKILSCDIEARTPLGSRFVTIPKGIIYANDFRALNQYCDEIRLLAYDQGTIDLKLNKAKSKIGVYMPIADRDWVKKVLDETIKTIKPSKIMLGIPTYGHEYEIFNDGKRETKLLRSLSYQDAVTLVREKQAFPLRNAAGEMSFVYVEGNAIRLVWYTDAQAIRDKIQLAKKYKLRGVVLFKLDGGSDEHMWNLLR